MPALAGQRPGQFHSGLQIVYSDFSRHANPLFQKFNLIF